MSEAGSAPAAQERRILTPAQVLGVARWLCGEGRWAEAERAYRHGAASAPEVPGGWLELGAFYLQRGRAGEAKEAAPSTG